MTRIPDTAPPPHVRPLGNTCSVFGKPSLARWIAKFSPNAFEVVEKFFGRIFTRSNSRCDSNFFQCGSPAPKSLAHSIRRTDFGGPRVVREAGRFFRLALSNEVLKGTEDGIVGNPPNRHIDIKRELSVTHGLLPPHGLFCPSPLVPPLYPSASLTNNSAICTALVAAPLRRLSLTHQNASPLGLERSSRIRPMKVSFRSLPLIGMG